MGDALRRRPRPTFKLYQKSCSLSRGRLSRGKPGGASPYFTAFVSLPVFEVNSEGLQRWLHYRSALCSARLSRLPSYAVSESQVWGSAPRPECLKITGKLPNIRGLGQRPNFETALRVAIRSRLCCAKPRRSGSGAYFAKRRSSRQNGTNQLGMECGEIRRCTRSRVGCLTLTGHQTVHFVSFASERPLKQSSSAGADTLN